MRGIRGSPPTLIGAITLLSMIAVTSAVIPQNLGASPPRAPAFHAWSPPLVGIVNTSPQIEIFPISVMRLENAVRFEPMGFTSSGPPANSPKASSWSDFERTPNLFGLTRREAKRLKTNNAQPTFGARSTTTRS